MRDVGRHLDLEERVLYLNIGVVRFWDRMRTTPPPRATICTVDRIENKSRCMFCMLLFNFVQVSLMYS